MANFPRVKPAGWAANEIYTATQANTLDIDHTKAPNFDDGSAHTPAADIEITGPNGIELQGTLQLKYASQTTTRAQPLHMMGGNSAGWIFSSASLSNQVAGAQTNIPLTDLSEGNALKTITLRFEGFTGHPNDPVVLGMPKFGLWKKDTNGTETQIGVDEVDAVTDQTLYQAAHDISMTDIGETIDLQNYSYFLKLFGESGANYQQDGQVHQIICVHTVTTQPAGF
jgi:hypothetical protein